MKQANAMSNALWANAKKVSLSSSRLIYKNINLGNNVGNIISNEVDRFSLKLLKPNKGGFIGFGSTINFDLSSHLRCDSLLLIDHSVDVVIAHECLYRSLFLAADTPEEFISFLLAIDENSLEEMYKQIGENKPKSKHAVSRFEERLDSLVLSGAISHEAMHFALEVSEANIQPQKTWPFKNIHLDHSFSQMIAYLYDMKTLSKLTRVPKFFLRPKNFSFLEKSNYVHLRNLYLNDKVQFAYADIQDEHLYETIAKTVKARSRTEHIYVSNIPTLIQRAHKWDLSLLKKIEMSFNFYETTSLNYPFAYRSLRLNAN